MSDTEHLPLAGRTVAITGPTSGVGRSAARELALRGAGLILLGRSPERLRQVAEEIEAVCEGSRCDPIECDLASFASVRAAALQVCEGYDRLDALIDNAGLLAASRTLTEDGCEATFQVNHLSHFLLTHLLRAPLTAAAPSRVVTVSSDAHFYTAGGIRFDDLGFERGWSPFRVYAHSKLANVMFARELADRWAGSGVTSNAVHPGPVNSAFGRDGWGPAGWAWDHLVPKLSAETAGGDVAWVAYAPELEGASGLYYYRRHPKRSSRPSRDLEARRRLWELSVELTGLDEASQS